MANESKLSILIVDDDKSNLDTLIHILKADYNLYLAKSGTDALKRAYECKPDLILLDILMPDVSGFDVLATLKKSVELRNIPVIFITGLTAVHDEERGFALGAVDYIAKPFNHAIVRARIRTHLKTVEQIRMLERLGMIDALTGLANRRSFNLRFSAEWGRSVREKTPLSLIMIDIDNFKSYNDTYGHPQGDILLKGLSRILSKTVKRAADLVARWGGEEFTILLPGTPIEGAEILAEEVRKNVRGHYFTPVDEEEPVSTTVSIGISCIIPTATCEQRTLLDKADEALYVAKRSGKDSIHTLPIS